MDEFPTCNELDVWGNFVLCMDKAVDSMDYVPFFIRRNGIILDMWREHLQEMRKGNLCLNGGMTRCLLCSLALGPTPKAFVD